MTTKVSRKTILGEAERIAGELRRCWPVIRVRTRLETREGEDAYLEIAAPLDLQDEILSQAAGFSVDLYDEKGIYILPEMHELN